MEFVAVENGTEVLRAAGVAYPSTSLGPGEEGRSPVGLNDIAVRKACERPAVRTNNFLLSSRIAYGGHTAPYHHRLKPPEYRSQWPANRI